LIDNRAIAAAQIRNKGGRRKLGKKTDQEIKKRVIFASFLA
jgi:hypothetical protein